jgi:hypothetical protein
MEHLRELAEANAAFMLASPSKNLEVVSQALDEVLSASPIPRTTEASCLSPPVLQAKQSRSPTSTTVLPSPTQLLPAAEIKPRILAPRQATSEITSSTKRKLPPPSEWSPEADPIVHKSRRTSHVAIGAERVGSGLPLSPMTSPWANLMPRMGIPYPSHFRTLSSAPILRKVEPARSSMEAAMPWMRQLPSGVAQRQSY